MPPKKNIQTPERLKELFDAYKEEVKANPVKKQVFVGKEGRFDYELRERPLTMVGFEVFVINNSKLNGIDQYFSNQGGNYKGFNEITKSICDQIFNYNLILYLNSKINPSVLIKSAKQRGINLGELKKGLFNSNVTTKKISKVIKTGRYRKGGHHFSSGFVYFVKILNQNLYKIGYSNNPKRRLTDISNAMPFDLEVLHIQNSLIATELEKDLHIQFKKYRAKGEWFVIDDASVVSSVIEQLKAA